ncbi:MAG: SDR family oxidoreductase [Pseudomonas sp.]|uniref:SDR family oxidoreductase n=1 Tax=Pseudomonas sp. TaxID=306 RepID=UPI0033946087
MSDHSEQTLPPQHQDRQPGLESRMQPPPVYRNEHYKASGKLEGKVAVITGADSGIGRAVAIAYAQEGARIVLLYLNEHEDAAQTQREITLCGQPSLLFAGDIGDEAFCRSVVDRTLAQWGQLDVLVNNAGEQHPQACLEDISLEQWQRTFQTNIVGMFLMTKSALPHMFEGAAIINTTSITAYRGHPTLIDYSATKGAITAFTRSLSTNLAERGIRVNAVAPGPIWTPLIASTFDAQKVSTFGSDTPLGRPGQPCELAPAYVYLACNDSSYMTGQVLHLNGGTVING